MQASPAVTRRRNRANVSRRVRDKQELVYGLVFIAPMLILLIVFTIYPILGSFRYAFYNWSGIGEPRNFVGWRYFIRTATDPFFWNAFRNNVLYTIVLVPVQLLLSLMLALVLNHPRIKFRAGLRAAFFLPVVISVTIAAMSVRLLFGNFSAQLTDSLGFNPPIDVLGSPTFAMWSVIVFGIWHSFGYNLVFFTAALQTVPEDLYDAAKVDGANGWQRLINITLPSIRPVFTIILFLAVIGSMNVFEQSWVLTGGGPFFASEVVGGYIYRTAFGAASTTANLGMASAASIFFNLLLLVLTAIQFLVNRRLSGQEAA